MNFIEAVKALQERLKGLKQGEGRPIVYRHRRFLRHRHMTLHGNQVIIDGYVPTIDDVTSCEWTFTIDSETEIRR